MPAQFFGAQAAVTFLNRAFANTSPSNAAFVNQTNNAIASLASGADATQASSYTGFAKTFGAAYAGQTPAALATLLMTNMGLTPNTALETALADYITAVGTANVGIVALQLASLLSAKEGDATYGAAATAWNNEVNSAAAYSVNTANTSASVGDVVAPPATQGQTFTLTASVDNVVGTGGDDTIVAGTQNANDTLNAGDQIAAGAGTDTLNIYAGAGNFGVTTVSGVEIINVYQDASLDVSGNSAVTQAWSLGGAGKTVTGTVAQTIGFGNASTGGAATATFTSVTGTSDAATIAVKDAGKTTAYTSVTVAGIESLTVNATGTNQLGTLTATSAAKLTFTGAGAVTTTLSDNAAYKTIDGSAATGALKITATGATNSAQVLDIKTGTANDTYATLFANLTKDDKIALGDGTDTIAFADATDLSTSANVALLAGVTGSEVIAVSGTGAFKADGDLLTQAVFSHSSTGAFTGTTFASTDKLSVGAAAIAASTVTMKLGQNTFNVDLAGSSAAASDATNGITVNGASTVNVASSGTSGVANNVLALTTDSNGTVNVTGSQNTTLTTALNAGTTGLSIAAGTFTGKLTVTGTAQGDLIAGGTGADTITGGDGTDSMTGGAGADTFAFAAADNAGANGAAVADIITDFVVGTDKLQFTGQTDVVSGQQAAVQAAVTALAAGSTDAQIATAMANANTTDLGVSFAVYNGNTYVYLEKTGATTTHVEADNLFIKLTGVTTAPTFAADVVA